MNRQFAYTFSALILFSIFSFFFLDSPSLLINKKRQQSFTGLAINDSTPLNSSNSTLLVTSESSTNRIQTSSIDNLSGNNNISHRRVKVLLYTVPWPFEVSPSCDRYGLPNCSITLDKRDKVDADAIVFESFQVRSNMSKLEEKQPTPTESNINKSLPESPESVIIVPYNTSWVFTTNIPVRSHAAQRYVFMTIEPPLNIVRSPGITGIFDFTLSYRRDADMFFDYGAFLLNGEARPLFPPHPFVYSPTRASEGPVEKDIDYIIENKEHLLCWIVRYFKSYQWRVRYFHALRKFIPITGFGLGFKRPIKERSQVLETIAKCWFYLSFENSLSKDYVTEKAFNPYIAGAVPIMLGPPREIYVSKFGFPNSSFIHIDDFGGLAAINGKPTALGPADLARYLLHLKKNPAIYRQFFAWRHHYRVALMDFWMPQLCLVCRQMQQLSAADPVAVPARRSASANDPYHWLCDAKRNRTRADIPYDDTDYYNNKKEDLGLEEGQCRWWAEKDATEQLIRDKWLQKKQKRLRRKRDREKRG